MRKKEEDKLRQEVTTLRNEVKQLRQAVNLLLEMMMEQDDHESYEIDYMGPSFDKNNDRFKMGM